MGADPASWIAPIAALAAGYLIGSIPFAYIIVKLVTGEDVTEHGSGNIGSMNVRRTTGSWGWFVVAMLLDGLVKGAFPLTAVKVMSGLPLVAPFGVSLATTPVLGYLAVPAMLLGCVLGHNYSLYMMLIEKRAFRTGKGLATGGGALFAYDWRYFLIVLVVALGVIAVTRYMLAGQVAAAVALPVTAFALRSPDWPFALLVGSLVYAAHHRRFVGLLHGHEPMFYVNDRMGPRG